MLLQGDDPWTNDSRVRERDAESRARLRTAVVPGEDDQKP
jgi:hypothetical protein